ncbi:MAG: enoyl-CoA hydratase/isomerase family protein, partial [Candidatus Nanopelagicales bacterium]|nr:enoyl-CoA hydratase/isomerase family protein [Candidatus Nanopelagicales bacterium]
MTDPSPRDVINAVHETIRVTVDGPVLRLTLNRPEVLNAFDARLLREVREVVIAAGAEPSVRAILVDHAGDRAFSAGIDVAYVKSMRGVSAREIGRELHRTFLTLRTTEIPIVCAIDGLCLGAGLEFAVSCDLMVASDRSRFGLPNIHRGIPAIVEAAILPAAIGLQGARDLAYLGQFWDANKAERRGLLQAVVPPEQVISHAQTLCADLAAKSPLALSTQKEIIHKWMTTDLESAIDFSINTVTLNFGSPDQQEAMQAFLDKRP